MNRQDFSHGVGRNFEIDFILGGMQNAYTTFNAFGEIVGNYSIIKGCETTGNNVTDGYVYIDGELYPFIGGSIQSKVVIRETVTTKPFEDGTVNEVLFERYVTFGTGTSAIDWSKFVKYDSIKVLIQKINEKATNEDLEKEAQQIINIKEFIEGLKLATETTNGFMSSADKIKLNKLAIPTNIGWFNGVDVGNSSGGEGTTFNTSGDIVSAIQKSGADENSIIEITVRNNMTSNYYVRFFVESEGDILKDNNINQVIFKKINSTKFQFSVDEISNSGTKNLKIHVETITIN